MYGCDSWTIKKAESWRIEAFELWCWRKLLSPLDSKIKPVNPKGSQPWKFIGRTDAEVEAPVFGHLMWRADSLEKTLMLGEIGSRRRRGWQRRRLLGGIISSIDMRTQWTACCIPWDCKELDTTQQQHNNWEPFSGFYRLEVGLLKGSMREFWGEETVLYLDCGYTSLWMCYNS